MTLRWNRIALVLLALGALATLAVFLLRRAPPGEFVVDATPPPVAAPLDRSYLQPDYDLSNRGGTYAGRVVDDQDRPVPRADVLLVALDLDAKVLIESLEAEGTGSVLDIPVFGEYRTAARGRTDAEGRFSLPAGDGVVVAVVAWTRGFAPGLLATTPKIPLKPGTDHVVRLWPSGTLRGTVVDRASKAPVGQAEVAIFFQTITNRGRRGPEPFTPTNSFARFQTYVARELGPLVWGIEGRSTDGSFRITTDRAGRFEFGPVMKEVQVEVVVTHPDYMWTETDPEVSFPEDNLERKPGEKVLTRRQRTVVPPGETVERTYELERGEEVRGTVKDGEDRPIEGVEVSLEHVSQYAQHPWYRTNARTARTDAKGRFRVAGLSHGPYTIRLTHPSFDTEYFSGVQAGSDTDYKVVSAGGWLELTVEGGPAEGATWTGRLVLEPAERRGARREERVVVKEGRATVERVRPGRYDLTIISGDRVSRAARVDVAAAGATEATLALVEGGGVRLSVLDASGNAIDPATVELEAIVGDQTLRRAAVLVSRQGVVEGAGLLPGRYRARVRAMEHVAARTEPFDVAEGRVTNLPSVTLHRQGYLRIVGVSDAQGRAVTVDVRLSIAVGSGPAEPARAADAGLIPVSPGTLTLRAEATDGRSFERTIEVGEGQTVDVEVRLDR